MNFDVRGNLIETIEMDFSQFQEVFVEKWEKGSSTRQAIFKDFEIYIADFKTLITPNFEIWVDLFSNTKPDRLKQKYKKGFVKLKIY